MTLQKDYAFDYVTQVIPVDFTSADSMGNAIPIVQKY